MFMLRVSRTDSYIFAHSYICAKEHVQTGHRPSSWCLKCNPAGRFTSKTAWTVSVFWPCTDVAGKQAKEGATPPSEAQNVVHGEGVLSTPTTSVTSVSPGPALCMGRRAASDQHSGRGHCRLRLHRQGPQGVSEQGSSSGPCPHRSQ